MKSGAIAVNVLALLAEQKLYRLLNDACFYVMFLAASNRNSVHFNSIGFFFPSNSWN